VINAANPKDKYSVSNMAEAMKWVVVAYCTFLGGFSENLSL
jgi:hypothetical protein